MFAAPPAKCIPGDASTEARWSPTHPVLGGRHQLRTQRPLDPRRWPAAPRSAGRARWVSPFERYAVIPVARNVWQQSEGGSPAAAAHCLIMVNTTRRVNGRPVSFSPARSTLWSGTSRPSSIAPVRAAALRGPGAHGWDGPAERSRFEQRARTRQIGPARVLGRLPADRR